MGTRSGLSAGFTALEDHDADSNYEVVVSVADSRGLAGTATATIQPETRRLTLASTPPGATLTYDGQEVTAPHTRDAAIGFRTAVSAIARFSVDGVNYEFDSWSDGGARTHAIQVTDAQDQQLTATYKVVNDRGPALLVVKDAAVLNASDTAVKQRLEAMGYVVTVASETVDVSEAADKSVVVLSSTISGTLVAGRFRDVTVPVVAYEVTVFDDMGMTGPTSGTHYGESTSKTSVAITSSSHQLAAGLTGTQAVYSSSQTMKWGKPAAAAVKAASIAGDSTRTAIFGYEAGAAMTTGTAPARRVGFFLHDTTATVLTENGKLLFDAAISWADGVGAATAPTAAPATAAPPPPPPPGGGALFVVKDAAALNASDTAVKQRLEALGYPVTVRSESAPASDATGQAVVVISSTVSGTTVAGRFRDVTAPVVTYEASVFDDMGMTGPTSNTDYGERSSKTSVAITAPSHQLAAGLTGTQAVYGSSQTMKWGSPAATAVKAASIAGDVDPDRDLRLRGRRGDELRHGSSAAGGLLPARHVRHGSDRERPAAARRGASRGRPASVEGLRHLRLLRHPRLRLRRLRRAARCWWRDPRRLARAIRRSGSASRASATPSPRWTTTSPPRSTRPART